MKAWIIPIFMALACYGCSSGGAKNAGQSVGNVLRAPVDFVSGLGSGITGSRLTPTRPFTQDWESEESDPVFWEEDETFFRSL